MISSAGGCLSCSLVPVWWTAAWLVLLPAPRALAEPVPCPAPWSAPGATPWHPCDPRHPEAQLHDLAHPPLFSAESRKRLLALLGTSCREGLELQLVVARPDGRSFSTVDHAEQLWRCGGERPDRGVLVTSRRGGLHARVAWLNHATVRRLARQLDRQHPGQRLAAAEALGLALLTSHRERSRTLQLLGVLAALSAALLLLITVRAVRRRWTARAVDSPC